MLPNIPNRKNSSNNFDSSSQNPDLIRLATPKSRTNITTPRVHTIQRHQFTSWDKTTEPLWERKSPRFFNAQKQVRDNPYPALYRGTTSTGAPAPLSKSDEDKIRPPTVTTPRRAVKTLLTTNNNSSKRNIIYNNTSEEEEERFEMMIRERAGVATTTNNITNNNNNTMMMKRSKPSFHSNTSRSTSTTTQSPKANSKQSNNNKKSV